MAKILVTRKIPKVGLDLLKAAGHSLNVWTPDSAIPRAELLKRAKGAHGILSLLTDRIDDAVLQAAGGQLMIVANYAVGYDNLDMAALKKRGIQAANTPGTLDNAVAEHAIALMFAVAKRIPEADRFTRAGKYKGWAPELLLGTELSGKAIGILGLGRIGAGVAKRALAMGMRVLYYDVKRNEAFEKETGAAFVSVIDLLKGADVVSIHVPLLPATRHLIDAKKLRLMKKTAILVNTSRGPVIEERALVAALKAKRLGGAGLDVYENEPKLAPGLAALPNVVLTPHTASATVETRDRMAMLAAQAIVDVLAGKSPPNLIRTP
jgi:glyoxylate reductase